MCCTFRRRFRSEAGPLSGLFPHSCRHLRAHSILRARLRCLCGRCGVQGPGGGEVHAYPRLARRLQPASIHVTPSPRCVQPSLFPAAQLMRTMEGSLANFNSFHSQCRCLDILCTRSRGISCIYSTEFPRLHRPRSLPYVSDRTFFTIPLPSTRLRCAVAHSSFTLRL